MEEQDQQEPVAREQLDGLVRRVIEVVTCMDWARDCAGLIAVAVAAIDAGDAGGDASCWEKRMGDDIRRKGDFY